MRVLTKLFGEKEYRDQFIDGNVYLSSFVAFTRVIPEIPLMALAESRVKWAIETFKNNIMKIRWISLKEQWQQ